MTSLQIGEHLGKLILEERKQTNEVLKVINLASETRAYLDLGYPSMFEWLTKKFGYSNAAAYRRIEAARLLRVVPEVAKKLEEGSVSLSSLAKAQSAMRAQEFETPDRHSK